MYELGFFLKEWQTLIGAFLGGIFALLVALIVAYKVRRRDEIASAYILLADLRSFIVQAETLKKVSKEQGSSPEKSSLMTMAGLLSSPPTLSPLFEESVMRVSPVNKYLAVHLALFKKIFSEIEISLQRLSKYNDIFESTGKLPVPIKRLAGDIRNVIIFLGYTVEHARCCENLLDKLIIRRTAIFHKLIRYICTPKSENDCMRLLKEGKV